MGLIWIHFTENFFGFYACKYLNKSRKPRLHCTISIFKRENIQQKSKFAIFDRKDVFKGGSKMSEMCFHTALLRADYWRKQQNRITTAALLGNIAQNKN